MEDAVKVESIVPKSQDEWLKMRKRDVTASEVAALFGVHPYTTALSMWADKSDVPVKEPSGPQLELGHIMEPAIAEALRRRHSWALRGSGLYVRAPELRIGATPDYLRADVEGKPEPVEMKFVQPHIYERDWSQGAPLAWVLQCLVQMYLLDAPRGHVVAMLDNRAKDIFIHEVPRNDEAWARIVSHVKRFWENVDTRTMPSPQYHADLDALRRVLPPNAEAEPLDLTGDNMLPELLEARVALKEQIEAAEERVSAIEAEIIHKLAGAPEARARGWRVTYKNQTRKEHLVKASTFSVLRIAKLREATNVV
jgi:predicted phage-related endonuclease